MVTTRHPSPSVATTPSDPIAVEPLPAPALVPMGPPWWGAVMGTGILSTLTQLHIGTSTPGAV
ncbi:MAG: hypothetical protein L0L18_01920, partial [Acidipropionibacterium jensenii]|nr:hypothetical protein [Acidipropionibacterium jensenii]